MVMKCYRFKKSFKCENSKTHKSCRKNERDNIPDILWKLLLREYNKLFK